VDSDIHPLQPPIGAPRENGHNSLTRFSKKRPQTSVTFAASFYPTYFDFFGHLSQSPLYGKYLFFLHCKSQLYPDVGYSAFLFSAKGGHIYTFPLCRGPPLL